MMCGAAPGSELTAWVKMCWRAWRQAEWEAALAWGPAAKDCRGVWAREDASAARFSRVSWEELELCAAAAAVVAGSVDVDADVDAALVAAAAASPAPAGSKWFMLLLLLMAAVSLLRSAPA